MKQPNNNKAIREGIHYKIPLRIHTSTAPTKLQIKRKEIDINEKIIKNARQLPNAKSSCPDGINAELLKSLAFLFEKYINGEHITYVKHGIELR